MDIIFWIAFVLTLLYCFGILYNWTDWEDKDRAWACLAACAFFLVSLGAVNEWGRSDIPRLATNVAKSLKTGKEYTVLGSYQAPKGTLVIVQDTKGTIRTLLTNDVPPPHFVVTDNDHVLALK